MKLWNWISRNIAWIMLSLASILAVLGDWLAAFFAILCAIFFVVDGILDTLKPSESLYEPQASSSEKPPSGVPLVQTPQSERDQTTPPFDDHQERPPAG